MSVLLLDSDFPDDGLEREALAKEGIELVDGRSAAPGNDPEGLIVMWTKVTAELLDSHPSVRVVGRFGVGVDSIDVDAATRRGVAVVHSGDYATEEVSAHAVAMALALLRRLPAGDAAVRRGDWSGAGHHRGIRRLSSLRAGVVGLGRIGRRVAAQLEALGLAVCGYDPHAAPAEVDCAASLDELVAKSDVLTLHAPLTAGTRHLIDARRFALMPPGSVLVNAARGGLVDQAALAAALDAGRPAAAALDVFEDEPLAAGHPLCARDDVLLSPHVGYFSEQAMVEARTRTVTGVADVLRGRRPRDVADPAALDREPAR
jgi:phosphoglycerate dehydrogenase-like enzyme